MIEGLIRLGGTYLPERATRRLARALPWIGAAIAILSVLEVMKRKGVLRGGVDSALDAIPVVGTMKNVAESMRGRDFISDRPRLGTTNRR